MVRVHPLLPFLRTVSSEAERLFYTQDVGGSSPSPCTKSLWRYPPVARRAGSHPDNRGSTPRIATIYDVVEGASILRLSFTQELAGATPVNVTKFGDVA